MLTVQSLIPFLALPLSIVAAPFEAKPVPRKLTGCSLSGVTMPLPTNQTTLTEPSASLSFVGLGVGVQNYTCVNNIWSNVGAVAELFDLSCVAKTPLLGEASTIAYNLWSHAPKSITAQSIIAQLEVTPLPDVLGQHYFVTNPVTGTGVSPKWDFTSSGATKGNAEAFVIAAKDASLAAPNSATDVPWLQLHGLPNEGELATNIYRIETKGGQPPTSCTAGAAPTSVKYTSLYYLFGSQLS